MAISFVHVSVHSRSKGHSAVAAAAYRAGTKLYDERLGKTFDYSKRSDVQFKEILLPEGSDEKFLEREFLWNEAERAETRKNSQVSKDFVLALPKELDLIQQIELTRRFANIHFVDNGIPVDIAIHDHGDGNPHAHILTTTRRLVRDRFHTHKARDLNPVFGRGYVKEEDHWNDKWRDLQNHFFSEKGIDLSVDLDHIIPERHHGGHRNKANHYIQEENEIIKEARQEIALNDIENFINILSIEHSVFTKRDIEILLFKTIKDEQYHEFFQVTVERVLSNKNVIFLGENEHGHKSFTTKHQFKQEGRLLKNIEKLDDRKEHTYQAAIRKYLNKRALNEEQKEAFDYIVNGSDISCIIGRPGVGKSYMLKPIKEFYESQGCRVIGAALGGKVAKQLESETGMNSSTIASLNARIVSGSFKLKENDILVVDEAGMVDFANMTFLVDEVKKARAKLILVGDPNQLKPIKKGSIFKGISDHVGCFTMVDIQRQKDAGDRQASIDLASGRIEEGLRHYQRKGALELCRNELGVDASESLMKSWDNEIQSYNDVFDNIILAHANSTVEHLNLEARQKLIYKNMIDSEHYLYKKETKGDKSSLQQGNFVIVTHTDSELGLIGGEQARITAIDKDKNITIVTNDGKTVEVPAHLRRYIKNTGLKELVLAKNDRVYFKKGDRDIGVKNGDIGTIVSINDDGFAALLDSGEVIDVPKHYKQLDYAYAMTVHKSQGMSAKNVFVCIDSKWWDRMLSFVAFTRHKEKLMAFANTSNFDDFDDLVDKLSRRTLSDNVIDYPFNLGLRFGFDFDGLVERAVNRLSGATQAIQNKTNYLYHYAKACKEIEYNALNLDQATVKHYAKEIATYLDMKSRLKQQSNALKGRSQRFDIELTELEGFDAFYKLSSARDKKSSSLLKMDASALKAASVYFKHFNVDTLAEEAKRHDERNTIKEVFRFAKDKTITPDMQPEYSKKISAIDMESRTNKIIINQLAKRSDVEASEVIKAIEPYQKHYRTQLLKELSKEHPVVAEYIKLTQERQKASTTYQAEQFNKRLTELANAISSNKSLSKEINTYLPKLRNSLSQQIQKGLDKDRGIEK